MKRIIICADGTWNKPERDLDKDFPTNVLRLSRAISTSDTDGNKQVVFYDQGIGSYHASVTGGAFGAGLNKNIMDCYRFIVHNYNENSELFFFGFSRGAYTVRSLCGLINNCGILKSKHSNRIQEAFDLYKNMSVHPNDDRSEKFRNDYAFQNSRRIDFVGVWDTVGALGVPFSFLGILNRKHLFHDSKIGLSIKCARHALSIDETRDDFKPTIWEQKQEMDLEQVWFAGVHTDVGGGYPPDEPHSLENPGPSLANIPLKWIMREAEKKNLVFDNYLENLPIKPTASKHNEYKGAMVVLGKHVRSIKALTEPVGRSSYYAVTKIHNSVKERYEKMPSYRPKNLVKFLKENNGWGDLVD